MLIAQGYLGDGSLITEGYYSGSAIIPPTSIAFGNTFLAGITNASGGNILSVAYTAGGWNQSTRVLEWFGYPFTLYEDGLGHYSLAVCIDSGASPYTDTYILTGVRFAMGLSATNKRIVVFKTSSTDTNVTGTVAFQGMPLAINAEKQLLLTSVAMPSSYEEEQPCIGGMPILARRTGKQWYLVVGSA